jgi:hypothetical protein
MAPLNGKTRLMTLETAKPEIEDADLLLFRGKGFISKTITSVGRAMHSHAAAASWHANGVLLCLEMREFKGGRAVTLASQVRKFPGRIDVFKANAGNRWPDYDRTKADRYMTRLCGQEYGYGSVLKSYLMSLPFVRWKATAPTDDDLNDYLPNCSAAKAMADDWGGGVDVVPHLANWAVQPGDLARSLFYEYFCTLRSVT